MIKHFCDKCHQEIKNIEMSSNSNFYTYSTLIITATIQDEFHAYLPEKKYIFCRKCNKEVSKKIKDVINECEIGLPIMYLNGV